MLASSSPRRHELMKELGVEFTVAEPPSDETSTHPDPRIRTIQNAEAKAFSVSDEFPDSVIIGADTIVHLDDLFLEKPTDPEDAKEILFRLSGKTHQVYTGVAVLDTMSGKMVTGCDVTTVRFKKLSPEMIEEYVASGEPLDKAGAYAIQGAGEAFVEDIVGSYSNVIGLPLELLRELFCEIIH